MKYKISILKQSLLIALVCTMFFSEGQLKEPVFSFKPVAGFNACQLHGDNAVGFHKFGFNGGVMVNARLNKKTSIDIGFVFTQKGARKNQNAEKGDYSFFRVNLNYIELPLLLNYKVNPTYFITLGPSIAYLINYQEDTEKGNWNGVYPFNTLEYGVNVGLGRKLKANWLLEVRSSNSFMPIRNYGLAANAVFFPNPVARFFNKGLYNNVLSLYIIYQIKLKPKSEPTEK
jgi:hypothetical protein